MTVGDATAAVGTVLQLWDRAKGYFQNFKPELTSRSINCRNYTCQMTFRIDINQGIRRKIKKIEIPIQENFRVRDLYTTYGDLVGYPKFYRDDDKLKLDTNKLPAAEKYWIILEGKVDPSFINNIIDVTPSKSRDQTSDYDSYWLDARISNMGLFAEIQKISEVDIKVNVSIDHVIRILRPPEMSKNLKLTRRFIQNGKEANRDEYSASPLRAILLKHTMRLASTVEFELKVQELINNTTLKEKYLRTTHEKGEPYDIGDIIAYPQYGFNIIPDIIVVNTNTNLTKEEPHARGYLLFYKKECIANGMELLKQTIENFRQSQQRSKFEEGWDN